MKNVGSTVVGMLAVYQPAANKILFPRSDLRNRATRSVERTVQQNSFQNLSSVCATESYSAVRKRGKGFHMPAQSSMPYAPAPRFSQVKAHIAIMAESSIIGPYSVDQSITILCEMHQNSTEECKDDRFTFTKKTYRYVKRNLETVATRMHFTAACLLPLSAYSPSCTSNALCHISSLETLKATFYI